MSVDTAAVTRALAACAEAASSDPLPWDAQSAGTPRVLTLAGDNAADAVDLVDWLGGGHGVALECFSLTLFRHGSNPLLSARREYPIGNR